MHRVEAVFQKHHYNKPEKRTIKSVEDFDPWPPEFRGTAKDCLPDSLCKLKGEQLCLYCLIAAAFIGMIPSLQVKVQPLVFQMISLHNMIQAFKQKVSVAEQNTREQRNSSLWYSVRQYCITASTPSHKTLR